MPEFELNFIAIAVAVVANFFFGFLWYTPLFGKAWAREMGMDPDAKPDGGVMAKGMILMVIGNFLMAYVFAHNLAVYNPESWGQAFPEMNKAIFAGTGAFFTWLGFFLPQDLTVIAWEQKSLKLFAINTSYHLLSLVIVGMILMFM